MGEENAMRAACQLLVRAFACVTLMWAVAGCAVLTPDTRTPPARATAREPAAPTTVPESETHVLQPVALPNEQPVTEWQFETSRPQVRHFLSRYQTRSRRSFEEALRRGSKYLPTMEAILAAEGVPIELAYLPIVESSFRLDAASWAGAVGPWQFVRATGRHYGLRIDDCVDERRDPERSTRAAARYLRYLYGRFGDWHLSLAAYNSGEAKIASIRRRKKVKSFWEMSGRGYLPKETSRFVPRFLAVMKLATSPQQYGLTVAPGVPDSYEWVTVDRPITVNTVAELSHTHVSSIKDLNPALRCGVVPSRYPMRVPNGNRHTFELAYARWTLLQPAAVTGTHRVRHGENPGSIARRYGVSVTELMEFNSIGNPRRLQIDTVLKIPDHPAKRIAPKGPAI